MKTNALDSKAVLLGGVFSLGKSVILLQQPRAAGQAGVAAKTAAQVQQR
jgi:hypothetical protein